MAYDKVYSSVIGLGVWKDDMGYTISGNLKKEYAVKELDAYEVEEIIKNKIACKNVEFDSEYCQFYAYTKTKQQALAFVERVEKYFINVKTEFDKLYK